MNQLQVKSNSVRLFRYNIKNKLKKLDPEHSKILCYELIKNPHSALMRMQIGKLLKAVHGFGPKTVNKILESNSISPYATLMELDDQAKSRIRQALLGNNRSLSS